MDRIIKARASLVFNHPWLASLVLRLDIKLVPYGDPRFPMNTAATDGRNIYFTIEFLDELNQDELIGVMCHEALHCAFQHLTSRKKDNHKKWIVACDFSINPLILESGISLPECALVDDLYKDMSAEEIFNLLPDKKDYNPLDDLLEGNSEIKNEWKDALSDAITIGMSSGKLPKSLERLWDDMHKPSIDWKELLILHLQKAAGKDDYNWSRPSRRGLSRGDILPSLSGSDLKPIAICVDTSGSISQTMLSRAIDIVRSAIEHTCCTVYYADAEVHHRDYLLRDDFYTPRHCGGGGGTSFGPALAEAEQSAASAIVYISADLEGSFPVDCSLPVIWITERTDNIVVPFGDVINLTEEIQND